MSFFNLASWHGFTTTSTGMTASDQGALILKPRKAPSQDPVEVWVHLTREKPNKSLIRINLYDPSQNREEIQDLVCVKGGINLCAMTHSAPLQERVPLIRLHFKALYFSPSFYLMGRRGTTKFKILFLPSSLKQSRGWITRDGKEEEAVKDRKNKPPCGL